VADFPQMPMEQEVPLIERQWPGDDVKSEKDLGTRSRETHLARLRISRHKRLYRNPIAPQYPSTRQRKSSRLMVPSQHKDIAPTRARSIFASLLPLLHSLHDKRQTQRSASSSGVFGDHVYDSGGTSAGDERGPSCERKGGDGLRGCAGFKRRREKWFRGCGRRFWKSWGSSYRRRRSRRGNRAQRPVQAELRMGNLHGPTFQRRASVVRLQFFRRQHHLFDSELLLAFR